MINKDSMKNIIFQIFLFGVVGGVTLLIDTLVTYILYHGAHLPVFLASGIGFLSGFFFNFPMNRKQVFRHNEHDRFSLKTQIILYALLSVFNLFATSAAVDALVNFHILEIQWAKVVITAIFAVWNFLVFRLVIFTKRKNIEED